MPEETELLIPIIRKRTGAKKASEVHLITYMAPLTRDMSHFDDLNFYALPPLPTNHQVPSWLSLELGIFAGRMYADFAGCTTLRRYMERSESSDGDEAAAAFSQSPAGFLLEWLSLRRKGQNVAHTPVGYVCQGRPLREDHHFFAAREADFGVNIGLHAGPLGVARDEYEDDGSGEDDEWAMVDHEEV